MWNETQNHLPIRTVWKWWTPTTVNVAMTLANTEYSYTLPLWTNKFTLKLRDPSASAKLNIWTVPAQSGTTYLTVPANCVWEEWNINTDSWVTLYFQSTSASQVAEITIWN